MYILQLIRLCMNTMRSYVYLSVLFCSNTGAKFNPRCSLKPGKYYYPLMLGLFLKTRPVCTGKSFPFQRGNLFDFHGLLVLIPEEPFCIGGGGGRKERKGAIVHSGQSAVLEFV